MCRRFNFKEATEWGAEGRKEGKYFLNVHNPNALRKSLSAATQHTPSGQSQSVYRNVYHGLRPDEVR